MPAKLFLTVIKYFRCPVQWKFQTLPSLNFQEYFTQLLTLFNPTDCFQDSTQHQSHHFKSPLFAPVPSLSLFFFWYFKEWDKWSHFKMKWELWQGGSVGVLSCTQKYGFGSWSGHILRMRVWSLVRAGRGGNWLMFFFPPTPSSVKSTNISSDLKNSPGWCGSVDWVPACEPRGCQFDSKSGHRPVLWARSPVGVVREAVES